MLHQRGVSVYAEINKYLFETKNNTDLTVHFGFEIIFSYTEIKKVYADIPLRMQFKFFPSLWYKKL